MRKQEQEALRRLEQALLEAEQPGEVPEDELYALDDSWQELSETNYEIYNTDDTDVDMDDYSEEVYRGRSGSPLGALLMVLTMILLAVFILWLLKFLGVI